MTDLSPSFLLQNPTIVKASAPWCRGLESLELAIVLVSLPWMAGDGLRRADLERQLTRLASENPIGPVYFQRVNRAVRGLERDGVLLGIGEGRARRFVASPEGFAALILNLRVLESDPTIDGSEFELKRSLVAMWNVLAERLPELSGELSFDEEGEEFFREVEELTVLGKRVVTEELLDEAMSVGRLIEDQRNRVALLREAVQSRIESLSMVPLLRELELDSDALLDTDPETRRAIRAIATRTVPELSLSAVVLRYEAYLRYLGELRRLYADTLKVANIRWFRKTGEPS